MSSYKNDYLEDFAYLYNFYKEKGYIPKEIKQKMMKTLHFTESKYYKVLKECRNRGMITDTYEENRTKMIERMSSRHVCNHDHRDQNQYLLNQGTYMKPIEMKRRSIIIRIIKWILSLFKK